MKLQKVENEDQLNAALEALQKPQPDSTLTEAVLAYWESQGKAWIRSDELEIEKIADDKMENVIRLHRDAAQEDLLSAVGFDEHRNPVSFYEDGDGDLIWLLNVTEDQLRSIACDLCAAAYEKQASTDEDREAMRKNRERKSDPQYWIGFGMSESEASREADKHSDIS